MVWPMMTVCCQWLQWWSWWQSRMKEGEENLQGERDRRSQWLFFHWCGFGFAGRLHRCLLVEEKGVCGVFGGWRHGGEKRKKERERRSRWLITDVVVAGRWSWQSLVVLVAQGRAGGRKGDGAGFLWRRKKEEETEEENLQRGERGRLVF